MTQDSFREAYGVLQRHADTLRKQQEPNIDDLLSIVTESVAAYKVCKRRIEAVEKALAQALGAADGAADDDSAAPDDAPPRPHAPKRRPKAAAAATATAAGGTIGLDAPSAPDASDPLDMPPPADGAGSPGLDPADDDIPF